MEDLFENLLDNVQKFRKTKNIKDLEEESVRKTKRRRVVKSCKCNKCGTDLIETTDGSDKLLASQLVCPQCATVDPEIFGTYSSFNNPVRRKRHGYKKTNHWSEIRLQDKGQNIVPEEIIAAVKENYRIYRIPLSEANERLTRRFLSKKHLKMSKYYEQVYSITNSLKKKSSVCETGKEEEILDSMFEQAITAWANAPPEIKGKRKSFPNYWDFKKRCCIYRGFFELAKKYRRVINPPTIKQINKIWCYFGEYCRWDGYEVAIFPEV
jgi:hypothetical protein